METTKVILNGIEFNVKLNKTGWPGGLYNNQNGDYSDVGDGKDDIEQFINAIDIDWNNAQVAGQTIKNTGHILSEINTIENILLNI